MTNNKNDGKWWLWSVALPLAIGVIGVAAVALMGCVEVPPSKWLGVDRAKVSCVLDDNTWMRSQTCVGDGRIYKCVADKNSDVWRCAELVQPRPPDVEAGGRP